MTEQRKHPRSNFIDKLKRELSEVEYSLEGLKKISQVLRLDDRADELVAKINERI